MDFMQLFREFGLIGAIFGAVITLLFLVVKWTLATTKDILKQAAEERVAWRRQIEEVNMTIHTHSEQACTFREQVSQAHNYQREEHLKFAEHLNEQTKALALICQALTRLNGQRA